MVTSNGERLIVKDIVRNGSLWSNVDFEKEVIFHEFDFETLDLEFEVSKSSIWKHTTLCDKRGFCFIIISQLRRHELKFSQVCYFMHMLRYTNEKTGFWQLPIGSSVFKQLYEFEVWSLKGPCGRQFVSVGIKNCHSQTFPDFFFLIDLDKQMVLRLKSTTTRVAFSYVECRKKIAYDRYFVKRRSPPPQCIVSQCV